MKKPEAYGMGAGVGLVLTGLAGLAIQHTKMPWQHDHAPQQKLTLEALMDNTSQPVQHHANEAVTDGLLIAESLGVGIFGYFLVAAIADLPESRRAVIPVDIPLQQNSPKTENIRVA